MIYKPSAELSAHLVEQGLEEEEFELDDELFAATERSIADENKSETAEQIHERTAYHLIWTRYGVPDPSKSGDGRATPEVINGHRIVEINEIAKKVRLQSLPEIKAAIEANTEAVAKCTANVTEVIRESQIPIIRVDVQLLQRTAVRIGYVIVALLLLIIIEGILSIKAHGQAPAAPASKIFTIKMQNSDGSTATTYAAPFNFKAGANCTFSVSTNTATFNCSGGAAAAGGSNTQVQWNSTGSLAGISSLTTDGTITTALAGADWLFADLTTPTKKFRFDASNISAVTTRTMNVPDANATFAQAITAVSHNFITQMSAQGVFTLARPACADISDAGVFCSGTAYSSLTGTPALPANTTATASNFFTAYNSTTGAFTKAQPAFSDISGTLALASAVFANQGTTTTVLHGNGAGNPSFASVTTSDLSSTTGNGTKVATGTGTYTSTHCVNIDANSNLVDSGAVCGGGSGTLATLTVGTASGGSTFSASTTYWLGQIQHSPSTTYADEAVMVPTTGTGTVDLSCSFLIGGTASAGNVAFSVCTGAAGATCTASTNMSMASRNVNFSATGLTLTPTAGALIAVKAVTPAWGTGASSTFGVCYIVIH